MSKIPEVIEYSDIRPIIESRLEQLKKDSNIKEDVTIESCVIYINGNTKCNGSYLHGSHILGNKKLPTIALIGDKSHKVYLFALIPLLLAAGYERE